MAVTAAQRQKVITWLAEMISLEMCDVIENCARCQAHAGAAAASLPASVLNPLAEVLVPEWRAQGRL